MCYSGHFTIIWGTLALVVNQVKKDLEHIALTTLTKWRALITCVNIVLQHEGNKGRTPRSKCANLVKKQSQTVAV